MEGKKVKYMFVYIRCSKLDLTFSTISNQYSPEALYARVCCYTVCYYTPQLLSPKFSPKINLLSYFIYPWGAKCLNLIFYASNYPLTPSSLDINEISDRNMNLLWRLPGQLSSWQFNTWRMERRRFNKILIIISQHWTMQLSFYAQRFFELSKWLVPGHVSSKLWSNVWFFYGVPVLGIQKLIPAPPSQVKRIGMQRNSIRNYQGSDKGETS